MAHKHSGADEQDRPGQDFDPQQAAGEEDDNDWYGDLPPFFRVIDTVVKTVMVILLVMLIAAVGTNVFGRFVLNTSMPGSAELSRFLFIWVIFLGAALAHLHNEHIAVTLFVERLSPSLQRWVEVLKELIILVVVAALLISSRQVMSINPGTSPLLGVPLQWVNVAVPISAGLMGVVTFYRIAVALRSSPDRTAA
ncbi:MAG: TRAP transporter small permease [Ornithinimicrobium sp.]